MYDQVQDPKNPHSILTGNTLLVGGVGRTDLFTTFGITSQTLAAQLYDSIHHHLLAYPPETRIFPLHGPGTLCAKHLRDQLWSTLGEEQENNAALRPMSKQTFVEVVTEAPGEIPKYFSHVAFLNRRDRPLLDQVVSQATCPLTLDQVLHEKSGGAQILDVRPSEDYTAGHLCGSLNIGFQGMLERWAGTLLNQDTSIILVADHHQEREAAIRLARVGLDKIIGYLQGGIEAVVSTPELIQRIDRVSTTDFQEHIKTEAVPYLLDVRSAKEWKIRHIDDSRNIPLPELSNRLSEIPFDRMIVVYCSGGYRSSIAASILAHHHFSKIAVLIGGFDAWEAAIVHPSLHSSSALQEPGGRRKGAMS